MNNSLTNIFNSCNYLLDNYPNAQETKEYLNSRITNSNFSFGYFPNLNNFSSISNIISEQELINNNLLYSRSIEDHLGPRTIKQLHFEYFSLIIPFKDPYGNIVALVGRTLLDNKERESLKIPKYKNTSFKKGNYLFGLFENKESIIENDMVYIVEGQFDVIKANSIGFNNVIALGTSHMTNYQFSTILRYTNNIILLLDNDEAGIKGRESIIKKYSKFANIQNFYIPESYKDIDEYISTENIKNFEDLSFQIQN